MKTWWATVELLGMPGLPGTDRGIEKKAQRETWPRQRRTGRGGGWLYSFEALPPETQAEIHRRFLAENPPPPALAPIVPPKPANDAPIHLGALDGAKLTRAEARLNVLQAFNRYRVEKGLRFRAAELAFAAAYNAGEIEIFAEVRAALPKVSAKSLFNWRSLKTKAGSGALGGRQRGRRESGKIDGNPILRDMIVAILTHQPHLGAWQILDQLRAGARIPEHLLPGGRRLQVWLQRWKDKNKAAYALAQSPDDFKNRFRAAFGSASEHITRANQLWEIDDTRADIALEDGRRVLIAVVDVATRRGMTLLTESPNTDAVMALVRRAMRAWGVPEAIKSDNGKNYTSKYFEAALEGLGVRHDKCGFFSPEQKPHVERFIGTIEHDLFEQLPGYVGHSVAERQAIRARAAFAQRLGAPDTQLFGVSLEAGKLQEYCETWCAAKYARRQHRGLNDRTPNDVAAEQSHLVRTISDERALDMLLSPPASGTGYREVGKKGVSVDGHIFTHGELALHIGARVRVKLDAADIGRIHVYDLDGKFICVAAAPELVKVSRQEHAAIGRALQGKLVAAVKEEGRRLRRQYTPERLAEEALQRHSTESANGPSVIPFPAQEIVTPAIEAAAEAARAAETPRSSWEPPVISEPSAAPSPESEPSIDWDAIDDMTGEQEPPLSAPERVLALWIDQNPDRINDVHRAWLAEYLANDHARFVHEFSLKRAARAKEQQEPQRKTAAG